MPLLESQDKVAQAVAALKEFQAAKRKEAAAQSFSNEKLKALKDITGITTNDAHRIEEEILVMVGRAHVSGLLES